MAKKVERKPASSAAAPKAAVAEDPLAILHPERELVIAARAVTIREYGFVEGLKLRTTAEPFLTALYAIAAQDGHAPTFTQLERLVAEQADCVLELVAQAANVEPEWISSLSDEDGYRLMQEWWLVNSGFFIRRVVQRLATEHAVARRRAGDASTTRSSEPATAAPPPTSAV